MKLKLTNNAETFLAGAITDTATTILLAPGTGLLFPNLAAGEWFPLTLVRLTAGSPEREIVYATARNVDSVTVIRGAEGTVPLTFSAGDVASSRVTAGCLAAKADLEGAAFTGAVSVGGNPLSDLVLRDYGLGFKANGTASTINIALAPVQDWTPPAGAVTLTITGWPKPDVEDDEIVPRHGELLVYGHNLGLSTITIAGAPVNFLNADTGGFTLTNNLNANSGVALQTNGIDFLAFWSPDGGVTRYGKVIR